MEQGTSTVYDGEQVIGKGPGEIPRHSLGHIARGSEGAPFFQWRQSRAGAETWHAAMLPHAGPDSRIFREVTRTGEAVARLGELAGSTVTAQVAVLDDPDGMWALEVDCLPSARLDCHAPLAEAHGALRDAGVTVDFAHPEHELSRYRLVIAPSLFLLSGKGAKNLRRYVEGGGTLLVQHATGYVDGLMHARLGGYPAAARGVGHSRRGAPAAADGRTDRSVGRNAGHGLERVPARRGRGDRRRLRPRNALGQPRAHPAPLRHRAGLVCLHPSGRSRLRRSRRPPAEDAGVERDVPGLPAGVEAVTRRAADGRRWDVLINHTTDTVPLPEPVHDLLTGTTAHELPPGGCAVLRGH